MGIAIFICLVIGALVMFFLLPRSVSLASTREKLYPIVTVVNTRDQYVFLTIRVSVFLLCVKFRMNEAVYSLQVVVSL